MKTLATASNKGTFFKSSSATPTRAISIVYSLIDDRAEVQASVCYAGQYQRHAVYGTNKNVQYDVPTSIVDRF
jgi:hypothetical protein